MDILQGIILGIIQGLTEFLPISSSGHLTLFQKIFGINEGVRTFDIAVHMATLLAVVFVFRKDIWEVIKKPFSKMSLLIIVGTIPTGIIAVLLKDIIEELLKSGASLGIEFIITGLVLFYAERVKSKDKGVEKTTYGDAILIGVAQGIAIMPAISRSGLTIAGALFRGLNREFAAKYSFMLSIPIILLATASDVYDGIKGTEPLGVTFWPLALGVVAAAISGYFAIKFMLKILTKGSLKIFSYYVFALGGLIILDQLFFHFFF